MSENQSIDSRPVCQHFAARRCNRGRFCRFLHVINIDRGDPLQENTSASNVNLPPRAIEAETIPESQRDDHQQPICKHFFHKGWCGFGKRCNFSHIDTRSRVGEHSKDIIDDYSTDQTICNVDNEGVESEQIPEKDFYMKESNVSRSVQPIQTPVKVCRFFRAGYCRLGWRCHYKHSLPAYRDHFDGRKGRKSNTGYSTSNAYSRKDELKPIHSETSSDSGVVDDVTPRTKRGVLVESISEAEEGKCSVKKEKSVEEALKEMRSTEIRQLKKRFPRAKEMLSSSDCTQIQFVFSPTDPDWPYDVKEMNFQVEFPAEYPLKMLKIIMLEDERVPETVRRSMTDAIRKWVTSRFETMSAADKTDLVFRPFLRWFDRKSEELLTEALKEYRRERMAEIAGVQFISADQLKTRYTSVGREGRDDDQRLSPSNNENENNCQEEKNSAASDENTEIKEENENVLSGNNSTGDDKTGQSSGLAARRGTEVNLQNLQLLNCAATLLATNVSLMISCSRCSNKAELKASAGQLNRAECPYCHNQQLIMFRPSMAHQFNSVIGYLDLDGCEAFDMILSDCLFLINCIECSKDNKLQALPPGQLNTTWCFHCHNKLTVSVNNVRFLKLETTVAIDTKNACTVEVKRRLKAVKDPAIVEGKPLPDNGTCKHFKRSFRWFRFPCCGKVYPCDHCHDEQERDHEMLLANRIICGFCAREQPYSSDRPCIGCHANITNKMTSHWEGGTGCRDKLKMNRGDSQKYADSLKTSSRQSQNKKDPGKKVTKLRRV